MTVYHVDIFLICYLVHIQGWYQYTICQDYDGPHVALSRLHGVQVALTRGRITINYKAMIGADVRRNIVPFYALT